MSEARDRHSHEPDDARDSPAVARQRCLDFATMHSEVPVYARIVAGMADDDDAIALLCSAAPGQARPVLLLAALHELTMLQPDTAAAQWFSPDATLDRGDPWPDVRRTIDAHRDELRTVVAGRSTQTNEVNRATYVRAMVSRAAADLPDTPVTIVELGASAGFLLGFDDYRVTVGEVTVGPEGTGVRCRAENRGAPVALDLPPICARVGVDAHPIGPDDTDDLRWLRACIWPEMPGRIERFDAAVEHLRSDPPELVRADMVDGLAQVITTHRTPGSHLAVFSSWALTYVARERRTGIADVLADAAADGPVSWVTAEPPGCVPGLPEQGPTDDAADRLTGTVVGARRWRDGEELPAQVWGSVHPHGNWINLH
ncbi:DUF2332 domain-containing protein [Calidifontibacter indicus]|uniref:DUF2332 domain-containing protein n=1 Tax=Calidifontibacter indicus TaxID=419650 RepID=UPI003D7509DB